VHLEPDTEHEGGELVLFVALVPGAELDDALADHIASALRRELSPRHVPDRIEAVPGIPRTLSGKKLEVPVKRILTGVPPEQAAARGSLANPESLDYFATLRPTMC
jgi:acetoacetyl-CoA synthetase